MKLYAWQPNGHGEMSIFVVAESEEIARAKVDEYISTAPKWDYFNGWGTDHYELTVLEPGDVITNDNG